MTIAVDFNCDLGEGVGDDVLLMPHISSASIACGWHAGDAVTMQRTVALCLAHGVALGAHPSLADREGFGRRTLPASPAEVYALTLYQIGALAGFARAAGATLHHVKPHGALYNMAARDRALADAIAAGVRAADPSLVLFGLPGSELIRAGESAGLAVAAEGFADRAYHPDGSLAPRATAGAVLHDPAVVVQRAVAMIANGRVTATDGSELTFRVDTLCVHGDTPGAAELVRRLREGLERNGVTVRPIDRRTAPA
jgi:UPF0271 protein